MPEMSGQQLLSALNSEGKKGKYIVVSADVQKGTKEEVEGYGIVTFINKPLTPDKLQQLINLIRGEQAMINELQKDLLKEFADISGEEININIPF